MTYFDSFTSSSGTAKAVTIPAPRTETAGVPRVQIHAPTIIVPDRWVPDFWKPKSRLGESVMKALRFLPRDLAMELVDRVSSALVVETTLAIRVMRDWKRYLAGEIPLQAVKIEDYGIVGYRQVVDNGAGFIVDAFQNIVELEDMKFHGLGTGASAEGATETALVTELTTEYTGNVRATGTNSESSQKVFTSVGTNTLDGTPGAALREHGLFSANTGGVLFDRTLYSAITLSSGDALQSTYSGTFNSGG